MPGPRRRALHKVSVSDSDQEALALVPAVVIIPDAHDPDVYTYTYTDESVTEEDIYSHVEREQSLGSSIGSYLQDPFSSTPRRSANASSASIENDPLLRRRCSPPPVCSPTSPADDGYSPAGSSQVKDETDSSISGGDHGRHYVKL